MVLVVVHFCWFFFEPDSDKCSKHVAVKLMQEVLDYIWLMFLMFFDEDERMLFYTAVTFCFMVLNFAVALLPDKESNCLQLDVYFWVSLFMSPVQFFILLLWFKSAETTSQTLISDQQQSF